MTIDIEDILFNFALTISVVSILRVANQLNSQFLFPIQLFCLISIIVFYMPRFIINTHKKTTNTDIYIPILLIFISISVGNIIYILKENGGHLLLIVFTVVHLIIFLDFLQELDIITLLDVKRY